MRKNTKLRAIKIIISICLVWLIIQSLFVYNQQWFVEKTNSLDQVDSSFKDINERGFFGNIINKFITTFPDGPGEGGKPVVIPENMKSEAEKLFKLHQFNLVASDIMSLNRSLPDYRISACQSKQYPKNLPNTSIIIVFHNEAWSTLLRTVHSAINRSPQELIHEIILVDDASLFEHLKRPLEEYVSRLSVPVKVYRMPERTGLIRARLHGAAKATGATMLFLDAHCESTEGWLEPLLYEIYNDRRTIVAPIIDVISENDFEYVAASDMTWGGFYRAMTFKWIPVPERENIRRNGDPSIPLRTPTIAGGLFAVDRNYFYELGAYDEGMDIWGAENLEISFRTWMCHGRLLIATCSRVGHVFRKASPYSWPGGVENIVKKNIMRTVIVWMDNYKEFFFKTNPGFREIEYGDISSRLELRKKNKCRSFDWYLKNIYPESSFPHFVISFGWIRHDLTNQCLDTLNKKSDSELGITACHFGGGYQAWAFTTDGVIMSDEVCIDGSVGLTNPVRVVNCDLTSLNHKFQYDIKTKHIKSMVNDLCLSYSRRSLSIMLEKCKRSKKQQWSLENYRSPLSPTTML